MSDSLLLVALVATGLVLPIRYVLHRVRTREARRSALEDGSEPPRFEFVLLDGASASALVLVPFMLELGASRGDLVPVDPSAAGVCTVAEGKSFHNGVERRMVNVSTYAEHAVFVDALGDALGSAPRTDSLGSTIVGDSLASVPDSTVSGARWPSLRLLTERRPVEVKATFSTDLITRDSVSALRRVVTLTANESDGTDALGSELSTRVTEVAQGILSDSPGLFRCTAVERYPTP